jgi:FAD/FMN-containing dehydrogenase
MSPYWLNNSCSPFTPQNASCVLGNIASYAINVSSAEDVVAGIRFAKQKNIRLSIKNTGHDFLGRSAGQGSLALWTHNLKSISFRNYSSPHYTGPAITLGAGVQAYEAYAAAADHGLRVTGGFCPTVGIVGGYVQGAGHGPLEGKYGLAADNTLEFEVITGEGKHLVASPTQNSDLFWALNGGGGGTYAVVLSQTTRAHPDGIVAGASLTFNNTDNDAFWTAVEAWHKLLLDLDNVPGANTFWGVNNETFTLYSAILPDANASAIAALLDPLVARLAELHLPHTYETNDTPNFYQHVARYTPGLPFGEYVTNSVLGGRLIPRSLVQNNLPSLIATFRNITSGTGMTGPAAGHSFRINGIASNVSHARVSNQPGANSVHPGWRDSLYWLNMDVYFDPTRLDVIRALQAQMNVNEGLFKALTPGGGAYINEATFDNPAWKTDYFGDNYDRLLAVKDKYDPHSVFYGPASVGSDRWIVASDGRLCRRK